MKKSGITYLICLIIVTISALTTICLTIIATSPAYVSVYAVIIIGSTTTVAIKTIKEIFSLWLSAISNALPLTTTSVLNKWFP